MKDFIEIERKFIIKMPERSSLLSLPEAKSSSILQIYLSSEYGVTRRIRRREDKAGTRYYETEKRRIDKISVFEDENEISESEFLEKSREIKPGSSPIIKERISFPYKGKTVEIDIYPNWRKCAVMEIELDSREECVDLPHFIEVIKEVTGEWQYSNAAMAEKFPVEIL